MKALLLPLLFLSLSARAGVQVYSGLGGEKLTIQDAPKLGKTSALIRLDGVESPWTGHAFVVEHVRAGVHETYTFPYELELSAGVQKKTYTIAILNGFDLKNGSRVPKIEVFYQGMPDRRVPLKLTYDEAASKAAPGGLDAQFDKEKFKPSVE